MLRIFSVKNISVERSTQINFNFLCVANGIFLFILKDSRLEAQNYISFLKLNSSTLLCDRNSNLY